MVQGALLKHYMQFIVFEPIRTKIVLLKMLK